MAGEQVTPWAWASGMSADLVLRILVPGSLGIFLLRLTAPTANWQLFASEPLIGITGFLLIGFLSYALYHGLYVAVISRISNPQLRETSRILEGIFGRPPSWVEVRATYIQWREAKAKGDPRLDYVLRVSPYIHAGYQSSLLFILFGTVNVVPSPATGIALLILGALLAAASFVEDRELVEIERRLVVSSRQSFAEYARQIFPEDR